MLSIKTATLILQNGGRVRDNDELEWFFDGVFYRDNFGNNTSFGLTPIIAHKKFPPEIFGVDYPYVIEAKQVATALKKAPVLALVANPINKPFSKNYYWDGEDLESECDGDKFDLMNKVSPYWIISIHPLWLATQLSYNAKKCNFNRGYEWQSAIIRIIGDVQIGLVANQERHALNALEYTRHICNLEKYIHLLKDTISYD